ncbi:MAG: hypothetical protein JWR21_1795 [Herminiimonas sp.]|nr:hypothetical protein [Herminiimonas sp.]
MSASAKPVQLSLKQFPAAALATADFKITQQGFAYCSVNDWQNTPGNCQPTLQFTPGKSPLHIWMAFKVSPAFIGKEVDVSYIFSSGADNQVIWSITGRLVLDIAEGIISVSFDDDPATPTQDYPAPLKTLVKGRYIYLVSIVTTDGASYDERPLPIIIR